MQLMDNLNIHLPCYLYERDACKNAKSAIDRYEIVINVDTGKILNKLVSCQINSDTLAFAS